MRFTKKLSHKFKKIVAVVKKFTRKRLWHKNPPPEPIFPLTEDLSTCEWDIPDSGERNATVADLCTHVGGQLPLQVVKLIARDVLRALENLHETRGIAHCDLNTNNINLTHRDMRALISQLSTNTRSEMSLDTLFLDVNSMLTSTSAPVFSLSNVDSDRFVQRGPVETCSLRAPEIILGTPYESSADIWSLGCIVYELLAGESLFDPLFQTRELELTADESHLIQMIELFGQFPPDLLSAGEYTDRWFTDTGALKVETTYYPTTLDAILRTRVEEETVSSTSTFLSTMLQLRPQDRARAGDIINHPWFTS